MTTVSGVGRATGGKPINLMQLQGELSSQAVDFGDGLGLADGLLYRYDVDGQPRDFDEAVQATVDQCIANHVAMRNKTTDEYAAEFNDAGTSTARKQEIRDIQNGLLPPEQVPMS